MQKIGLNKCKDKNIKYSSIISDSKVFSLGNLNLKQINSTIIDSTIINTQFINHLNSIKVILQLTVRIIYSTSLDNSLYVYDKHFLTVQYIPIPRVIEGIQTDKAFIQKKIKTEVFIENIISKIIDKDSVLINYYIIVKLKINPGFYISYSINNSLFSNIFVTYSNGENLTQKTFTTDLKYSNILWQPNSSNISFIGSNDNSSSIYLFNCNSLKEQINNLKTEDVLENVNVCKNVNDFVFGNENEIFFLNKEENLNILYTMNLKRKTLKKITSNLSENYSNIFFNSSTDNLYSLCLIDNINCLCSFDKNCNFEILFDFSNVYDYIINKYYNKAIIKILNNGIYSLYTLDLSNKMLNPIILDFEYEDILKFRLCKNIDSKEILILRYLNNTQEFLAIHDLYSLESTTVKFDDNIYDFEVDFYTNDIFIVLKNDKYSKIIKINLSNLNEKECILKIPSFIECISLKN